MTLRSAALVRPQASFAACAASQRGLHIAGIRPGNFAQHLPVDRRCILEVTACLRLDEFPANEVAVAFLEVGFDGSVEFYLVH